MQEPLFPYQIRQESSTEYDGFGYHGTAHGYRLGCRCDSCKRAKRVEREKSKLPKLCVSCGVEFWYNYSKTGLKRCESCNRAYQARRRESIERASKPRRCKKCDKEYFYTPDSKHGTKYCEDCLGCQPYRGERPKVLKDCPSCGTGHVEQNKYKLCRDCFGALPEFIWRALIAHRAPVEFALYVASVLCCEICESDITAKKVDAKGRLRSVFAIDHDHDCCPGGNSCGSCLRGILCKSCNSGIGYLGDDPQAALRAAKYLRRPERPGL